MVSDDNMIAHYSHITMRGFVFDHVRVGNVKCISHNMTLNNILINIPRGWLHIYTGDLGKFKLNKKYISTDKCNLLITLARVKKKFTYTYHNYLKLHSI